MNTWWSSLFLRKMSKEDLFNDEFIGLVERGSKITGTGSKRGEYAVTGKLRGWGTQERRHGYEYHANDRGFY